MTGIPEPDWSRRKFILALSALMIPFLWLFRRREIPVPLTVPDQATGHRLRDKPVSATAPDYQTGIAIIGGGISGLSAGWWLSRSGYSDYRILELEDQAGGNSRAGQFGALRFPWGAHYLPVPNPESEYVRLLLSEMKLLRSARTGDYYPEENLVQEPAERLFIYGSWQPGLYPSANASAADREAEITFRRMIRHYKEKRGSDGRRLFAIPLRLSSADPEVRSWDRMTFDTWLRDSARHPGFIFRLRPRLSWYIDYCLRDDYGGNSRNTSAWAALHYFCARQRDEELIWPEGNAALAEALALHSAGRIATGMLVRQILPDKDGYLLTSADSSGRVITIKAQKVIYAAPKFTLPYTAGWLPDALLESARRIVYAPWLVVNLLLRESPGRQEPAWDNVIYGSQSLGYIHSAHSRLAMPSLQKVLTWYRAFDSDDTKSIRELFQSLTDAEVLEMVFSDLGDPHPELEQVTGSAGIARWAHAMVRPVPGAIFDELPRFRSVLPPGWYWAHSDIRGMSLFEEAQDSGVQAAIAALN